MTETDWREFDLFAPTPEHRMLAEMTRDFLTREWVPQIERWTDQGEMDVETWAQAGALGLLTLRMPSGAGHDAQSLALIAPAGMIFIPSIDGISHSPDEYSRPEDVEAGTNVLLRTLLHRGAAAVTSEGE